MGLGFGTNTESCGCRWDGGSGKITTRCDKHATTVKYYYQIAYADCCNLLECAVGKIARVNVNLATDILRLRDAVKQSLINYRRPISRNKSNAAQRAIKRGNKKTRRA